jgi:hypothetical protein
MEPTKMNTPSMTSTAAYDQTILQNAVKFAAALVLGKGRFANAEADTLAEIAEKAAQLKADHPTSTREVVISAFDAAGNRAIISGAPAKPAEAGKAKAAKPAAAPKAEKPARADKPLGRRAQIEADAANGILPAAPDFSAATHARFRKKLDEVVALVAAADIKGLKAYPINPLSSSPKALDKYRNLAVTTLEAQKAAAKKAAKAEGGSAAAPEAQDQQPAEPGNEPTAIYADDLDIPAFLRR